MHFQLLPAVATLAALTSTYAQPIGEADVYDSSLQKRDGSGSQFTGQCTDGVVVYMVRGSDPSYTNSQADNPNSAASPDLMDIAYAGRDGAGSGYIQSIRYPATINDYFTSLADGIKTLKNTVEDYVAQCPNGKVALVGYSQGGQVVTGVLGGSKYTSPVNAHQRIAAAVAIADPTFVSNLAIDRGSAAQGGNGGTQSGDGTKYNFINTNFAGRFVSFCQKGDRYCDSADPNGQAIHNAEVQTYKSDASSFMYGTVQQNT